MEGSMARGSVRESTLHVPRWRDVCWCFDGMGNRLFMFMVFLIEWDERGLIDAAQKLLIEIE